MTGGTAYGAAPPAGPGILLAADLPEGRALALIRELYALRRFGCRLDLIARPELRPKLGRYPALGAVWRTDQDLPEEALDQVRAVVLPPSLDLLSRLALGLDGGPAAGAALAALGLGLKVYMDVDRLLKPGRNEFFNNLYARRAEEARAMGLSAVPEGRYLSALLAALPELGAPSPPLPAAPEATPVKAAAPGPAGRRMTVTRQDVLDFDPRAVEWPLPHDAIITPLARDAARERGLSLARAPRPGPGK